MKKLILTYTIILSILVTGCSSKSDKNVENTKTPIKVETQIVNNANTSSTLQFSGKVQAVNSAEISTKFITNITKIHVNVGDKVKKGNILVTLDALDIKAQLAQADAQVSLATASYNNTLTNFNRFKNLYETNSASKKEFDDIQTQLTISKSQLEGAKQQKKQIQAQLQYAQITAPFSGIITAKFVKEGDIAKPGMPIITIEDTTTLEIVASIPESEIVYVKPTTEVIVFVPALQTSFKSILKELSTSSTNSGNQFVAIFSLPKQIQNLYSGMHAKIDCKVEQAQKPKNITVYKNALVTKGELTGVYTVSSSNTAILRWLQLGEIYENEVEVLSGLQIGDAYITKAEGKLYNGAKLTVN